MKRIISFIISTTLLMGLLPLSAFANTATIEVTNNYDFIFYHNGQQSSYVKDLKDGVVDSLIKNELITETELAEVEPIIDLVDTFFLQNQAAIVLSNTQELFPTMYVMMDANMANITTLLNTTEQFEFEYATTDYNGVTIYHDQDQILAAALHNGQLFLAQGEEAMKSLLDSYQNNQTTSIEVGTAMAGFFSSSNAYNQLSQDALLEDFFTQSITNVDVLITESNGNFELISKTQLDQNKLNDLNIDLTDYVDKVSLYQILPQTNTLAYVEAHNLLDFIYKFSKASITNNELATDQEFLEFLELIKEMSTITNGNTAILLQTNESSILPYITFATEVDALTSTQEKLRDFNETLYDVIAATMLSTETTEDKKPNFNQTSFYSLPLNNVAEFSELAEFGDTNLSFGSVNGGEVYLISTNPSIQAEIGSANSLAKNSAFANVLGDQLATTDVFSISYADPAEFATMLNQIVLFGLSSSQNGAEADQLVIDMFSTIEATLAELPPMSSISTIQNNSIIETTQASMPIDAIINIMEAGIIPWLAIQSEISTNFNPGFEFELEDIDAQPQDNFFETFSDVPSDDFDKLWYGQALVNLSNRGIVRGSNGKFNPGAEITRAEFIAMIVRYLELDSEQTASGNSIFSDVPENAWFNQLMGTANEYKIINADGTATEARPLAPITRAEAVTILENVSQLLQNTNIEATSHSFTDLTNTDWFYDSAVKSYQRGIMLGRNNTEFAPFANLSRAEAIVLIDRLRKAELFENSYEYEMPEEMAEEIEDEMPSDYEESMMEETNETETAETNNSDEENDEQPVSTEILQPANGSSLNF